MQHMKESSYKMLRTVFDVLAKIGIYPNSTMLVGSIALDIHGILPEGREPNDVDLVIKDVDENTKSILGVLQAASGIKSEYHEDNFYSFILQGVKVNIWIDDFHTGLKTSTPAGYAWLTPVSDILDKKRSYGRKKDYQDIAAIAAGILKK